MYYWFIKIMAHPSTNNVLDLIKYSFCSINTFVIIVWDMTFFEISYCWWRHVSLTGLCLPSPVPYRFRKLLPVVSDCGCFLFSCLACAHLIWSHKCYLDHTVFIRDSIMESPKADNQTTPLALRTLYFHFIFTSHHKHF